MNPFLPLWEYTPDGEPHIFGDRIYLFGSHDTKGGDRYCSKGDYVGWSAQLDDLSDWRYEGVMYTAEQDPHTRPGVTDLYAPDVVQSKDAAPTRKARGSNPPGRTRKPHCDVFFAMRFLFLLVFYFQNNFSSISSAASVYCPFAS